MFAAELLVKNAVTPLSLKHLNTSGYGLRFKQSATTNGSTINATANIQPTSNASNLPYSVKISRPLVFLVEYAKKCMEELEIVPRIQPIRGGTDGARLSYMGLPCPNLCAGGHNFHGRYEYVCVESMEKIVELLVKLASERYV